MPLPKLDVFEKTDLDIRRSINRLEIHRLNNPDDAPYISAVISDLKSANNNLAIAEVAREGREK